MRTNSYLMTVPASESGKQTVANLRNSLRIINKKLGNKIRLRVRARGKRAKHAGYNGLTKRQLWCDLPVALGERFDVYLDKKENLVPEVGRTVKILRSDCGAPQTCVGRVGEIIENNGQGTFYVDFGDCCWYFNTDEMKVLR